jgi:predicted O-methyltransferase YrrM
MNSSNPLPELLSELEAFGKTNDATGPERPKRMLNITRDTGEFLAVLVRATKAVRILEIGTSNGYSTLWLASACELAGAHVTTVELSAYKIGLAAENFRRGRMERFISQHQGDATTFLSAAASASFDFIFLDSERSEYVGWWPDLKRVLVPGGLLVVDNATSHPAELAEFVALVRTDQAFTTSTVDVGNGEFLAVAQEPLAG